MTETEVSTRAQTPKEDDFDDAEYRLLEIEDQLEAYKPLLQVLARWRRARVCLNRDPAQIEITEEDLLRELQEWELP